MVNNNKTLNLDDEHETLKIVKIVVRLVVRFGDKKTTTKYLFWNLEDDVTLRFVLLRKKYNPGFSGLYLYF